MAKKVVISVAGDTFAELSTEIARTLGMLHAAADARALAAKLGRAFSRPKQIVISFPGDTLAEVIADMNYVREQLRAAIDRQGLAAKFGLAVGMGRDGRPGLVAPTTAGGA